MEHQNGAWTILSGQPHHILFGWSTGAEFGALELFDKVPHEYNKKAPLSLIIW